MGTWEGGIVALPWAGLHRLFNRQTDHLDAVGELG